MLAWQRGHTPSRQASSEGVRLSGGPSPIFPSNNYLAEAPPTRCHPTLFALKPVH